MFCKEVRQKGDFFSCQENQQPLLIAALTFQPFSPHGPADGGPGGETDLVFYLGMSSLSPDAAKSARRGG
jgi:hypothetical protein